MPCTGGSEAAGADLEAPPDPDDPEDEEERRLLPLRDATARLEPLRAELLRRVVVVERLLATGVTSTVAEEAAESEEAATALDAVLFFAPADTWPEALAETDVVDAAEDAEERRRGAGLAMGIDAMGEIKGGSRSVTHPASSGR